MAGHRFRQPPRPRRHRTRGSCARRRWLRCVRLGTRRRRPGRVDTGDETRSGDPGRGSLHRRRLHRRRPRRRRDGKGRPLHRPGDCACGRHRDRRRGRGHRTCGRGRRRAGLHQHDREIGRGVLALVRPRRRLRQGDARGVELQGQNSDVKSDRHGQRSTETLALLARLPATQARVTTETPRARTARSSLRRRPLARPVVAHGVRRRRRSSDAVSTTALVAEERPSRHGVAARTGGKIGAWLVVQSRARSSRPGPVMGLFSMLSADAARRPRPPRQSRDDLKRDRGNRFVRDICAREPITGLSIDASHRSRSGKRSPSKRIADQRHGFAPVPLLRAIDLVDDPTVSVDQHGQR
jgi:hypothetical protein